MLSLGLSAWKSVQLALVNDVHIFFPSQINSHKDGTNLADDRYLQRRPGGEIRVTSGVPYFHELIWFPLPQSCLLSWRNLIPFLIGGHNIGVWGVSNLKLSGPSWTISVLKTSSLWQTIVQVNNILRIKCMVPDNDSVSNTVITLHMIESTSCAYPLLRLPVLINLTKVLYFGSGGASVHGIYGQSKGVH